MTEKRHPCRSHAAPRRNGAERGPAIRSARGRPVSASVHVRRMPIEGRSEREQLIHDPPHRIPLLIRLGCCVDLERVRRCAVAGPALRHRHRSANALEVGEVAYM